MIVSTPPFLPIDSCYDVERPLLSLRPPLFPRPLRSFALTCRQAKSISSRISFSISPTLPFVHIILGLAPPSRSLPPCPSSPQPITAHFRRTENSRFGFQDFGNGYDGRRRGSDCTDCAVLLRFRFRTALRVTGRKLLLRPHSLCYILVLHPQQGIPSCPIQQVPSRAQLRKDFLMSSNEYEFHSIALQIPRPPVPPLL